MLDAIWAASTDLLRADRDLRNRIETERCLLGAARTYGAGPARDHVAQECKAAERARVPDAATNRANGHPR